MLKAEFEDICAAQKDLQKVVDEHGIIAVLHALHQISAEKVGEFQKVSYNHIWKRTMHGTTSILDPDFVHQSNEYPTQNDNHLWSDYEGVDRI